MTQHGCFHWNELMTRDTEKMKTFYADTVGWTFDSMDMGDGRTYWIAKVGDTPVAGLFPMAGPDFDGVEEHWMPYLAVDGVDALLEKAKGKGAEVLRAPFDVPGIGGIAILREPGGAMIGWMTPAPQE